MSRTALSLKARFEILERDKFTCQYCGRSAQDTTLEIDHRKSVADGGTDDPNNLVTSCFQCNRGKGRKSIPTADEYDEYFSANEKYFRAEMDKNDIRCDVYSIIWKKEKKNGQGFDSLTVVGHDGVDHMIDTYGPILTKKILGKVADYMIGYHPDDSIDAVSVKKTILLSQHLCALFSEYYSEHARHCKEIFGDTERRHAL